MSFSLAQRTRQSAASQLPPLRGAGAPARSNQARLRKLQRKLTIGATNDPQEHEAERAADQVMAAPSPAPLRISRKCAACDAKDEQLQAKAAAPAATGALAPPSVHAVLDAPGRPLDAGLRGFFEPRLGADLSQIRIHDGAAAARSAEAVGARAYTVGQDVVFGAAQYRPGDPAGMHLMAHELAHSVQQGAASQTLARACLSSAECDPPAAKKGSLDDYVKEKQAQPENKSKADTRAAACNKTPPDPACTADGHGRVATELTKYMTDQLPARVSAIYRLIVDMDIPYAGNTIRCDSFKPEIPGGAGKQCTFVPNKLELEAARYNAGDNTVGGMDRLHWSQLTQRLLTHETEHAMFAAAEKTGTEVKDPAIACDFAANRNSLTELAAEISEFRPVHAKALALTGAERDANLAWWFDFWIKTGGQNISGNVKSIRCNCDCGPADALITKMFNFATKDWNTYEKWLYNKTLQDPKWGLNWPVTPPASVPIDEIPNSGPTINVADLPTATPPAKSPATPPAKP